MKKWKLNRWGKVKSVIFWLNPGRVAANLKKFEFFLFYLLIFFLPAQLAYHFWPKWAFVLGVRVDYLAWTIYSTDIFVMILLVIWLIRTKFVPKYLFWVFIFAFINLTFSISSGVTFFKWLKIFEFLLFSFYVSKNKVLFRKKVFSKLLCFSLVLFSLIGIAQFLLGKTIGGPFYFLGERTFNVATPGIALQNIFGKEFMRSYSTFSHPNSFAGFLFVCVLVFFPLLKKAKYFWLAAVIMGLAFLLTFSRSAFLGSGIGLPLTFIRFDLNAPEIKERINLMKISGNYIAQNFFWGTGLGTFPLLNSARQPVHNVFLLAFTETGIVGVLFLSLIFYKFFGRFKYLFVFLLITGLLDHYWLTLQQNMLLLALVYGYLF